MDRPVQPIVSSEELGLNLGTGRKRPLILPHGWVEHNSQIVATTTDYLNEGGRLSGWDVHVAALFSTKTIVFVGYSLSDLNFQRAYMSSFFKRPQNAPMSYFVQPAPHKYAVEYWKRFNLTFLDCGGHEFAVGLALQELAGDLADDRIWKLIVSAHEGCLPDKADQRIRETMIKDKYKEYRHAAEKLCR